MKSTSKLKDDARQFEQQEQWDRAINVYLRVLKISEAGEAEVDLPLYNRVGDLYIRLAQPDEGVKYYEQAADRYADIGLYNSAIALCNKALRYRPQRLELLRKLGQYSAQQGFLSDATRYYVEYAEKLFAAGDLDQALGALEEFAILANDAEVLELLGRRLQTLGRAEAAAKRLLEAHALRLAAGQTAAAAALLDEVRELDPAAAETAARGGGQQSAPDTDPFVDRDEHGEAEPVAFERPADAGGDGDDEDAGDGPVSLDAGRVDGFESTIVDTETALDSAAIERIETEESVGGVDDVAPLHDLEPTAVDFGSMADAVEEAALEVERDDRSFEAPHDTDADESWGDVPDMGDLPLLDDAGGDAGADRHERLPLLDQADSDSLADPEPAETASAAYDATLDVGTGAEEEAATSAGYGGEPDEGARREGEAPAAPTMDIASELARAERARAALAADTGAPDARAAGRVDGPHPPGPDATAGGSSFIDLSDLLIDDVETTTRFRVTEVAPTGDEDRDFAELLNQFKAKLSAHLPPEDAAAHYDLGLAFREMGLLDEAITEFQIAARAGHMRLKIFEELGQCFLEKQQYNIAEKVLRRALDLDHRDELELLGVYYHLGRACEALGRRDQARDAYERVLGMDINFQDVAERLSRL